MLNRNLTFSPAALSFVFVFLCATVFGQERIEDDLLVLYNFGEGQGAYINDVSGNGTPLTLKIHDTNNVNWIPGGGLNIDAPTLIKSFAAAEKVTNAVQNSGAITMEAWIDPANLNQDGPARIATVSYGASNRNCTLGQEQSEYAARVRTDQVGENGTPQMLAGSVLTTLQHIVYTMAPDGAESIYVNGDLIGTDFRPGTTSNWNEDYPLALVNEVDADRPWLGKMYLVGMYGRALSANEVQQNYEAGHLIDGPEISSTLCEEEDCFIDGFGVNARVLWIPNLPDGGFLEFKFNENGGHFDVFADGTAHMYGETVDMQDPTQGWFLDVWYTDRMHWDEWSDLGRGWKGDAGLVGNNYLDWDYFIMDADKENVLVGTGGYDGSLLNLTHKPINHFYGLQVGVSANDQNEMPGMSCWFYYTGTVNGVYLEQNGDINLEGDCVNLPVMACAVDVEVDCNNGYEPSVTGEPTVYCLDAFSLDFWDEVISADCPLEIIRHWLATHENGDTVECEQSIVVVDDEAPVVAFIPSVFAGCSGNFELLLEVSDNCDPDPSIVVLVLDSALSANGECSTGQLRTQTMGGWGTTPSGNNPGMYLLNHFDEAFPDGLTIGCDNTLHLSSPQHVIDFLPSGTTPALLPAGDLIDPGSSYSNVLAGQLVAATISVAMDQTFADFGESDMPLANLILQSGDFEGYSVSELLLLANSLIGGCQAGDASAMNAALSSINENFVDGAQDNGFLSCSMPWDCFTTYTIQVNMNDQCGNSSSETITAYGVNEDGPTLPVLEDIAVNCGEVPPPIEELPAGCEGGFATLSVQQTEFSGTCFPIIERIYTAQSACGATSTATQYITVIDIEAPVFTTPLNDLNIDCSEFGSLNTPEAADNCDLNVEVGFVDQVLSDACPLVIERTYTAMDDCGNMTSAVQNITVADNQAPHPTAPIVDLNLDCFEAITEVVFVDDCGLLVAVQYSETQEGEGCSVTLTRTWVATDACNNSAVYSQVVTISDDEAPVFTNIPLDVDIACDGAIPMDEPTVEDACGNVNLTYIMEYAATEGACAQWERTWTATDDCGNVSLLTQIVSIIDNEAPVLSGVPTSLELNCGDEIPTANVTVSDNCDSSVEVVLFEEWEIIPCGQVLIRSWSATDACGNAVFESQAIAFSDNEGPSIIGEFQIAIDCNEVDSDGLVEVIDDCYHGVILTYDDSFVGASCEYSIERTWTATDACGNTAILVQTLLVNDNVAPSINGLDAELILNCGDALPIEEPLVEDACSSFELSYEEVSANSGCSELLIRTWTATDACGNTSVFTQEVTFVDNSAPVFETVLENLELQCGGGVPAVADVVATDDCTEVTISMEEVVVAGNCAAEYEVVRIWTALDACGNGATLMQTISFVDNSAPVFDQQVVDETIACGQTLDLPAVTATDACSAEVTIGYEETTDPGGCPNIYRFWTATDDCGNQATMVQTITVDDSEPPLLLGVPSDTSADCNTIPEMPVPEVNDNCDEDVAVTVSETIVGSGCDYTIIRTWIAQDDCGNTTIESYSIQVNDTADPVFVNAPGEVTVECNDLAGYPYPEVYDDCGGTVLISFEDQPQGSGCAYDIIRVYTATDMCGNMATAEQLIHVMDMTPPTFIGFSGNQYVSCNEVPNAEEIQAVDACSANVDIQFSEQVFGEGCEYYIQRSWTATDECGNSASIVNLVYVSDEIAPVIEGVPANVVLDCYGVVPSPDSPTIVDNCSDGLILNYFQFIEENECETIYTRVWSGTDDCGNTASATQLITVTDLTAPAITNVPADTFAACGAIPSPSAPNVFDACDANVQLSLTESTITGECPYTLLRIWTAVDACGNSATATQQVFVADSEAPMLSELPADMIVACGEIPPASNVFATDNCAGFIAVSMEETWEDNGSCNDILHRTWIAIDYCGNTAQHTQLIQIVDYETPVFEDLPTDVMVECQNVPEMEFLEVVDNCSVPSVMMVEHTLEGECSGTYTLVRTWTAIDACGNSTEVVQIIDVIDETAPEFSQFPADTTVTCAEIPEVPELLALDACGESIDFDFTEDYIGNAIDTAVCALGNTEALTGDVALWLPDLAGLGSDYVFGEEGGLLVRDLLAGTAHITGQVFNTLNPNLSWNLDLYLYDELDWGAWSANGGMYKDDFNVAGENYLDWTFYKLSDNSRLIGALDFAGSSLSLSHAPFSFAYGFQFGQGANNRNDAFGMSGWFYYTGLVNGIQVDGVGDVMTENNCCEAHDIIRTWSATDCSGNTSTWTQVIHVNDEFEIAPIQFPAHQGMLVVNPDGAGNYSVSFTSPFTGPATLFVLDLGGNIVDELFNGHMQVKQQYEFTYNGSGNSESMYLFQLQGERLLFVEKELVRKY
jgi:hypothetical protein